MRRMGLLIIFVVVMLYILMLSVNGYASTKTVIYFVPHQDDEVLTMGNAIAADVARGNDVKVVFFTDGSASGARAKMCKNDGYCLSVSEFVSARNNEAIASLEVAGVPRENIFFEGYKDGHTTYGEAMQVIVKWHTKYPNASLNTMSWLDVHPDHYHLGKALRDHCNNMNYRACTFWQSSSYYGQMPLPGKVLINYNNNVTNAASEYKYQDISAGRYGIGWNYSVKREFDYLVNTRSEGKAHGNTNKWSRSDEKKADAWMRKCQVKNPPKECFNKLS